MEQRKPRSFVTPINLKDASMLITLELECRGTHICRVRKSATSRAMTVVWVVHRLCVLRAPVCCQGALRLGERKRADWNEHQPTHTHMMYHTGQYLFLIPISTGPATPGGEWRYRKKLGGCELGNPKFGWVTNQTTSFRTRQTLSVLGMLNNACCRNRGGAHLVS